MDLKEFVAESLREIIDGITKAQDHAVEHGAEICPRLDRVGESKVSYYRSKKTEEKVSWVEYDIAVSAEDVGAVGGNGKLSVKVASILNVEAGVEGKSIENESSISRLQFKIPVVWPLQHQRDDFK